MGIDDEFDEPNLFMNQEECNLMFLYIISMSYDIIKIYYSFNLFVENYRVLLMMVGMLYGLERYLVITTYEFKKNIIVLTSFIFINDMYNYYKGGEYSCVLN